MNTVNNSTGLIGENIAFQFLHKNGFIILDRNFKIKFGEIDIVAKKNNTIHIIEVKTKKTDEKGSPYLQIDYKKMRKLIALANIYSKYKGLKTFNFSIDIISIVLNKYYKNNEIKFYENVTN